MLHEAAESNPSVEAYWALLLELYRVRGLQTDFERTALGVCAGDGCRTARLAADVMPLPPIPRHRRSAISRAIKSGPEIMSLTGMMWGAADPQLAELRDFAEEREYVNIDLSQLKRLDFSCGSAFASPLNELPPAARPCACCVPTAWSPRSWQPSNLDPASASHRHAPAA